MKIIRIEFRSLRNEEHFQFMTDMNKLFNPVLTIEGEQYVTIRNLYFEFGELYHKEDAAIERIRRNILTDPIADADMLRDNLYRGLMLFIDAFTYHSDPAKIEAARKLKIIVDNYGDFRRKSYNEETATIYNFVQDVKERCTDDLRLIGGDEWLSKLDKANGAFETLMSERYGNNVENEAIDLRQTRLAIDEAFMKIRNAIEATNLLSGGTTYAELIQQMNERIAYYKNTIATRKGVAKAKKEREEEDSDDKTI